MATIDGDISGLRLTEPERTARDNLRQLASALCDLPIEEYTRVTTLGQLGGFSEAAGDIHRIRTWAARLVRTDLTLVPNRQIDHMSEQIQRASGVLQRTTGFTVNSPSQDRREIIRELAEVANGLFERLGPILMITAASQDEQVINQLQSKADVLEGQWEERLRTKTAEVEALKTEAKENLQFINQTVEAAKVAAADVGIEKQSVYFETQATEHKNAALKWLVGSFFLLLAILGAAGGWIYYYLMHPEPQPPINIQLLVEKVVLFSALFGGLVSATRSYRAHRHNYVVNKHRHNALLTFRAFSQQASADPATKNAVLLQTTQCIFSPQPTGYSSHDVDSGYPPIVEIVRSVMSPSTKH
jgi:hypothetical protein